MYKSLSRYWFTPPPSFMRCTRRMWDSSVGLRDCIRFRLLFLWFLFSTGVYRAGRSAFIIYLFIYVFIYLSFIYLEVCDTLPSAVLDEYSRLHSKFVIYLFIYWIFGYLGTPFQPENLRSVGIHQRRRNMIPAIYKIMYRHKTGKVTKNSRFLLKSKLISRI
jgi:hypothetical protein